MFALHAAHLTCEYRVQPAGVDVGTPRLGWILESPNRGEKQTRYRILVATAPDLLRERSANLWDSGPVESNRSFGVVYQGRPLRSGQRAWWSVQSWDQKGRASGYAAPSWWEAGMMRPDRWRGEWIGDPSVASASAAPPCPYLRRRFQIGRRIVRARLFVTARGLYRAYINGKRIGRDEFTPGWTDYRKRIQYQTYDVTDRLRPGQNVIGMILGDGWYCGRVGWQGRQHYGPYPKALAQLEMETDDGTRAEVVSDGSWKVGRGPIQSSDLLLGESYDARQDVPAWSEARFDDRSWGRVATKPQDDVPLVGATAPTVQVVDRLQARSVTQPRPGAYVFDLGQNMVGHVQLRVQGPRGATVTIRHAEMLNPDGTIYTANLRSAAATDRYTLSGHGVETYEPLFTFHGFRYVELTGCPAAPSRGAVTGIVLHSATPPSGSFKCSNALVNQLQHNIYWGQLGNTFEVPTDCPQRDERLGWMGDAQIFARTACANMEMDPFYTKWLRDVDDAQSAEGGFSDVSPRIVDQSDGAPAWGDAGVIVPWTVYQCYGDKEVIDEHYAAMAKWNRYVHDANPELIWRKRSNNNFGDWLNIGDDTPRDVLATAYFVYTTHLLADMARATGRTEDASRYESLFQSICSAFQHAFVDTDGRIKGNTQTDYVLALRFGLLSETDRTRAADHLVDRIRAHDWHLTTGFVGVGYLLPTLTSIGRSDVAFRLLENETFPSWGYSIRQGATTIWERWDGWTRERGFQDPGMNSFNHYSLGSVGEWLYSTVGGIDLDPNDPGYHHIILHPVIGNLSSASARINSAYGPIKSSWKVGASFKWDVTIPPNTTATLYVPAKSAGDVQESGMPAARAPGVRFARIENKSVVLEAASGDYHFRVPRP